MNRGERRATAADVAAVAGVSQSAVSRAFTPGARIAPDTRRRVLAAAHALGYQPNAFARALAKREIPLVGILMQAVDNGLYPGVLEGFARRLSDLGKQVMLFVVDDEQPLEATLTTALQYRLEAMILTSVTLSSSMARTFAAAGMPVVLFNRHDASPDLFAVIGDNVGGGRLAAELPLESMIETTLSLLAGPGADLPPVQRLPVEPIERSSSRPRRNAGGAI